MDLSKRHQTRRANKYNAKRLNIAGESYDSGLEAELHATLKLLERAGEIENIRRQVVIQLTRNVKWRADFLVYDKKLARDVIHEAKGYEDARWRVIVQLLPEFCPFDVKVWGKQRGRLSIVKEIGGKNG